MGADKDRGAPGAASAEIEKYLDILARDPNSRVFAPLAEAYRKAGLLDDAIETALEGLNVHPNYLGGRVALGRAYFEKRQYAEAAAEMQKVVKVASDNIMAHKVLGQVAYALNDLPSAEKAFKMVLLLDPRDQEARQFLTSIGSGGGPAPQPAPPPRPAPAPQTVPAPAPAPSPAPAPIPIPPPASAVPIPAPPPAAPPSMTAPVPATPHRAAASPSLPVEELPDLAIDDISLEQPPIDLEEPQLGPVRGLTPAASGPPGPPPGPAPRDLEEGFEIPGLDLQEPQLEPERAPEAPPPIAAAAPAPEKPAPAPGRMELEVFARVPWGLDHGGETPPPASAGTPPAAVAEEPAPAPAPEPPPGESPFEVFGRPKPGGPPVSTKGEREAFSEIELEPTAYAPVEAEAEPSGDAVFEVFTRDPRGTPVSGGGLKPGHGESQAFGDLDLETTAYMPPEPEADAAPVVILEEEIPRIDLQSALEEGVRSEPGWEEPVPEAPPPVVGLEEEIPPVDLAGEMEQEPFEEEYPDLAGGVEEPPSPQAEPAARGVFDTETLASIYVNQGFYGRAAEIYERLLVQRPGDGALRQKLEELRALERSQAGPVAAPPEPAAAAFVAPAPERVALAAPVASRGGTEETIRRLNTLLEAFRGGRPR